MNSDESMLLRNASHKAFVPLFGMLGGLSVGALRASLGRQDELTTLLIVLRAGIIGTFLGLATILIVSLMRRRDLISLRRLMVLVLVAGLICWYAVEILFALIG